MNVKAVIGGVEGGATHSTVVLLDSNGEVLVKRKGPGTNYHLLGITEWQDRIALMINEAKKEINLDETQPLKAIGLSLSGCEHKETNKELVTGLASRYPNLSTGYAIGSDTQGSIAATSSEGGIVCISGTGSNTLLLNPDGTTVQCGGWGYLLGDEGAGYYSSFLAVKICIDALDGFKDPPHSIDRVWELVQRHFQITEKLELLQHFYGGFDKAFIASLCKDICDLARDGDPLAKQIMEDIGRDLARSIAAVIPKASPQLVKRPGGIHVLTVGSVWNSWDVLKPGFMSWMTDHTSVEEFSLMKLTTTMAVGAAYMAADQLKLDLPRIYNSNYEVFYNFKR